MADQIRGGVPETCLLVQAHACKLTDSIHSHHRHFSLLWITTDREMRPITVHDPHSACDPEVTRPGVCMQCAYKPPSWCASADRKPPRPLVLSKDLQKINVASCSLIAHVRRNWAWKHLLTRTIFDSDHITPPSPLRHLVSNIGNLPIHAASIGKNTTGRFRLGRYCFLITLVACPQTQAEAAECGTQGA
jgi:hypothetical protein